MSFSLPPLTISFTHHSLNEQEQLSCWILSESNKKAIENLIVDIVNEQLGEPPIYSNLQEFMLKRENYRGQLYILQWLISCHEQAVETVNEKLKQTLEDQSKFQL